jgi:UDP-N-acetylglucosamine 2-epimerase (non-hydrolysing)
MPEEINRLVTDQLADFLFTSCKDADDNLKREGISPKNIHFVGNVMIDTLVRLLPEAQVRWDTLKKTLRIGEYALVTFHRPSNVDYTEVLSKLVTTLVKMSNDIPIIFPVHPRTRMRISEYQLDFPEHRFRLLDPLGYLEFIALELHATVVITDSGGIQEESTYLGIPCLTVRETTERPITITMGTNVLVGHDTDRLIQEVEAILNGVSKKAKIPPLWDGHASERIARIIA